MAATNERALQTVRETRFLIDRYDRWLLDEFGPCVGQRVLEVGCGLGNLLVHFADRQFVVGIDICADCINAIKLRFANQPNIVVLRHDITDPRVLSLAELRFDTLVALNVLEHIEDDEIALAHMCGLLQPGGSLVLVVPAHERLFGAMDRAIGHCRRYCMSTLLPKLERSGFEMTACKLVNAAGALGWMINGRLLKRSTPPNAQLRLINRIIPALEVVEHHVNPPFGVSLLAIAHKPR